MTNGSLDDSSENSPFRIGEFVGHLRDSSAAALPQTANAAAPVRGSIGSSAEVITVDHASSSQVLLGVPDDAEPPLPSTAVESPESLPETVFRPVAEQSYGFVGFARRSLALMREQPGLVHQMFRRDFAAMYKSSFLGLAWLVLTPLATMASWLLLRYSGVILPSRSALGSDYILFILINITLWSGLRTVISTLRNAIKRSSLLLQVRFPHEAIVLQNMLSALVQLGIPVVLLMAFMAVSGNGGGPLILLLPVAIIPLYLLGLGVGLIVAPFTVVFPDVTRAVDVALGFMFVATPIIYQRELIAERSDFLNTLLGWNPVTHLLALARTVLIGDPMPALAPLLATIFFSAMLVVIGVRLFAIGSRVVVERLV